VKIVPDGDEGAVLVAKSQILSLQSLDGTDVARDVAADRWSSNLPDLA